MRATSTQAAKAVSLQQQQNMEIAANITGIQYQLCLTQQLSTIPLQDFNINKVAASCIVSDNQTLFGISKWVSPKRTRSYPYERVYNTLSIGKKITVIPLVKDEGFDGDTDFIQWDTISLMNLLDVYVIIGYYNTASKNKRYENKITNQQFDNEYILRKIQEIAAYHSSALHWNLKELRESLPEILNNVKNYYSYIANSLSIKMHAEKGLEDFQRVITVNIDDFMLFSRQKAREAQSREFVTIQPKESLHTLSKAKITITNYLGGKYFLTVDEVAITPTAIRLIEAKHAKSSLLPSLSDIKDGLLKMILFCNLKEVSIENTIYTSQSVLLLTSTKLLSSITSSATDTEREAFFSNNPLSPKQKKLIEQLFLEANTNGFTVIIEPH